MDAAATITGRFAAVVDASPNRVAVVDEDGRHTYRAVDELSNAVACALLDSGRDERAPVAVWLPAGRAYVAGIIGTLKAGQFYSSLTSAQPAARTSQIVANSRSELVVTSGAWAADAATLGLPVIRVDELTLAAERILPDAKSTSPYCVHYTSGSTGGPKGALHSHATLGVYYSTYPLPRDEEPEPHPPWYQVPSPRPDDDGRLPWELLDNNSGQDGLAFALQGSINDRSREHLGLSDRGVIQYRTLLQEQVRVLESGRDPMNVFRDPTANECLRLDSPGYGNEGIMRSEMSQKYSPVRRTRDDRSAPQCDEDSVV